MAFSKNLYQTINTTLTNDCIIASLSLNPSHPIYEGHFPEQSITPGVVQMAIVKELLEEYLHIDLALQKMNNCKFLAILNPDITNEILVHIDFIKVDDEVAVKAVIKTEGQICLKLKSTYRLV
jgi:3-hydroxyacyl-[acyl-carrier-protein] dehydratase